MKTAFVVSNVYLLGILALVVISNYEYASGGELLIFIIFALPVVLAIFYANKHFNNILVKWLLFAGYSFATIAFSYLILEEGGDAADYFLAVGTLVSLIFGASYMFNSKVNNSAEGAVYDVIAKEKQEGYKDEGLWIQAVSKSGGNEKKVEAIYIKLRAKKLLNSRRG